MGRRVPSLPQASIKFAHDGFRYTIKFYALIRNLRFERPYCGLTFCNLIIVVFECQARSLNAGLELLDMALHFFEMSLIPSKGGILFLLFLSELRDLVAHNLGAQLELVDFGLNFPDAVSKKPFVLFFGVLVYGEAVQLLLKLDKLGLHFVDRVEALRHRLAQGVE